MRKLQLTDGPIFETGSNDTASTAPATPRRRKLKNITLLEAMEAVAEAADKSGLTTEFLKYVAPYTKLIGERLGMSPIQAVLLSVFVDRCDDNDIRISELASFFGIRPARMLRLENEIKVLERMHYVRSRHNRGSYSYRIPIEVTDALKENRPYTQPPIEVADTEDFFNEAATLFNDVDDNELSYDDMCTALFELLRQIKDSTFCKQLDLCKLDQADTVLFIFMAHLFVDNDDDNIGFHDLKDLYDDGRLPRWLKSSFINRTNNLFRVRLVENAVVDGFQNPESFKLTDHAKEQVLAELSLKTKANKARDLISHTTFAAKRMVYNDTERAQIDELTSILGVDRFAGVQQRLKDAGMRTGFCSLFYGSPGTGKTETVQQIARLTGRDVMRVDVDKIKSCWVGESEKNIKKLFDRYRAAVRESEVAPILLFNEADAVLGTRMEGASRAVDKMENSIQNIILQEMETLEGILIATTNLTDNLDPAFERRFLYKIRFSRPTAQARAQLWQSMLHGISADDAKAIAANFDLSGGEIENIARKHSVNTILTGDSSVTLDALTTLCRQERIQHKSASIGFA